MPSARQLITSQSSVSHAQLPQVQAPTNKWAGNKEYPMDPPHLNILSPPQADCTILHITNLRAHER